MEENQKVYLYLDSDEAGMKNTQTALKWERKYIDRSHLYKNHKDLNEYLLYESQQLKPSYVLVIPKRLAPSCFAFTVLPNPKTLKEVKEKEGDGRC